MAVAVITDGQIAIGATGVVLTWRTDGKHAPEASVSVSSVPFEFQLWSGQECADYLGCSYSQFMRRTQYAPTFPKRCPIPGQPRWSAKAVSTWALGQIPPESRQAATEVQ